MKAVWILVGAVVALVILGAIGYGGYRIYHHTVVQTPPNQFGVEGKTMRTEPTIMVSNSVYEVMPSGKLGPIFTDTKGRTLYIFKNDSAGVSHCVGGCLKAWPAYIASSQTGNFPSGISVIKRSDGTLQYAWKEMPLYYFSNDKKSGDVNGEGIGGAWSVVK
jgi:predicted lipoprotein with Yx(FWY)xxD motif